VLEAGDPHKIKQILPTYINKIIVYRDRIEAHFRLSVDDTVCARMVAANRSQLWTYFILPSSRSFFCFYRNL